MNEDTMQQPRGLAAQSMQRQKPQQPGVQGRAMPNQDMLRKVIEALKSGMDPKELAQQGIPLEVIEAALAEISQEQQMMEQKTAIEQPAGLAAKQGMLR